MHVIKGEIFPKCYYVSRTSLLQSLQTIGGGMGMGRAPPPPDLFSEKAAKIITTYTFMLST